MPNRLLESVLGGRRRSRSAGRQENEESPPSHGEAEQPQPEESELPSYDESTSVANNALSNELSSVSLSAGLSTSVENTVAPSLAPPDIKKAHVEPESSPAPQPSPAELLSQAQPQETSASSILIRNPQSLLATALKFHNTLASAHASSSSKPLASFDDEPQIITIHPHNQQVYLELLNHDAESFAENSIAVKIPQEHRNHWVSPVARAAQPFGSFSGPGGSDASNSGIVPASATFHSTHVSPHLLNRPVQPTHYVSPPAQPLRVARLVIGPDILAFWSDTILSTQSSSPSSSSSSAENRYIHLLTVEGLSGPQIRKYLSVPGASAALSTIFQELANGYSVVFVALMLRDEWERSLNTDKRRFAQCGSAQRLTAYRDRDGGGKGDAGTSLGLPPPGYAKRKEEERRDFGIMF